MKTQLPRMCTTQDVNRVLAYYGKAMGAGKTARRLLQNLVAQQPMVVGEAFPVDSVGFPLCKHLLLQERSTDAFSWEGAEETHVITCRCFALTYLMPQGCLHTRLKLWQKPHGKRTLCYDCSKCLRCSKNLDCSQCKPGES